MKLFTFLMMMFAVVGCTCFTGCAGYTCGSSVPQEMRNVHVAVFENNTKYSNVGAMVSQHLSREIIEDGTFALTTLDTASLRIHGNVSGLNTRTARYDRNNVIVPDEYDVTLTATVYVYNTKTNEMLMNGQQVSAHSYTLTRSDYMTGINDVLPSLTAKLAQNILEQLQTLGVTPVESKPVNGPSKGDGAVDAEVL